MAEQADLFGYTYEAIGTTFVGILVILGILGNYLRTLRAPAAPSTIVAAGVGFELGNRQQTDQIIAALIRIADAIEGKKQAGMEAKLDDIMERLDRAERR